MNLKQLKPRKALNKAYLKMKPNREEVNDFKKNLIQLLDRINDTESEEYHKNLVTYFLKQTYYEPNHYINTKDRSDLVIHNGENRASSVGVIIETKKPTNKWEMITTQNVNAKAFHELLLYYLRERITNKNIEIKHLIITNSYEWYIFDANLFDRIFAQNKELVRQFNEFESGKMSEIKTSFFYDKIAHPFIESISQDIEYTYFDIRDYEMPLRNENDKDDNKLIALFKLFSPEHLLKLPFANDSNTLDKRFYEELLHIMGLSETKEGGKKVIEREKEGKRNIGSILENTINELDSLDKISRLDKPSLYGNNMQERLFNVALELNITWMNRILFLKLLEAQLIKYHKGNESYLFLNLDKIENYDDLNSLFFKVLARKQDERGVTTKDAFQKVPYLNSSLFEPTELEHTTLLISNLGDNRPMPIYSATVLKDENGKRLKGNLNPLEYLFKFLDAYDFTSEGSEEIQEDNKTLINASVLGLIFEKINGYKDGSFFTPGFITMYMCRETIRKAVIKKFNEEKKWNCETISHLYNKIDDTDEANNIVNSLKICDPAVGSGHFLVSALNEIITIKNDLRILKDRDGLRLKEYHVEVENDELIVTDEDGSIFEYNPTNRESQRIQEALFHEKQTIIENCLFGVDINPNSVKICRLRLWIELLKNAYYKNETELETLPNIDINIKCGNTLISRFPIDSNLGKALKKSKWTIDNYRFAVSTYRNAHNKEEKREMMRLIDHIKNDFRSEIASNDPMMARLHKIKGQHYTLANQTALFEQSKKEKRELNNKMKKLTDEINKLEEQIEEIKNNKIFENAFEWRFEFPEVLNKDGDFVGFDVVIGNPPYIRQEEIKDIKPYLKSYYQLYTGTADIYIYFIEKGFDILKSKGIFTFIMPNKFMQTGYGKPTRGFLLKQNLVEIIDFGDYQVFDEATTYPCILIASKETPKDLFKTSKINSPNFITNFPVYVSHVSNEINHNSLSDETWIVSNSAEQKLLLKVNSKGERLENYITDGAKRGVLTGLTKAFVIDNEKAEQLININPENKKHIHPFLLGREAKPYIAKHPSKYLLKFAKGFTKKFGGDNPEEWFESKFPEIHQHLNQYIDKAKIRTDKGDYYWELRACDYYAKFEKPKIMYQVFQVKPCFIYDEEGFYCNNSIWFIPTDDKVLLGILNSLVGWWLISKYCTAIQNGYQLIWEYFSQIPIAKGNNEVRQQIGNLVNDILSTKKQNPSADTTAIESKIDILVYQLYELNEEEIELVKSSLK